MFSTGALRIAKIFGINIEIDYSWIIIFILVVWSLSAGFYPLNFPELPRSADIALGVVTAIVFFASVIFHELAHSLVAKKNGLKIHKITLFMFGGASQIADEPQTAPIEFKMAIAGPLSSLFLAAAFYLIVFLFPQMPLIYQAPLRFLSQVNFILAVFNLIPGYPLDGGRVFRSIIWYFNKDFYKSTRYAVTGGRIVALGLIVWGFFSIFYTANFGGLWFVLIGFFLNQAAVSSLEQTRLKLTLEEVDVKDLMEKPISVPWNKTLSEALAEYFQKERLSSFPVTRGDKVIGTVNPKVLNETPREKWPEVKVSQVMKAVEASDVVTAEDKAFRALMVMDNKKVSKVPVIDKLQRLVGIITENDLNYYLSLNLKS